MVSITTIGPQYMHYLSVATGTKIFVGRAKIMNGASSVAVTGVDLWVWNTDTEQYDGSAVDTAVAEVIADVPSTTSDANEVAVFIDVKQTLSTTGTTRFRVKFVTGAGSVYSDDIVLNTTITGSSIDGSASTGGIAGWDPHTSSVVNHYVVYSDDGDNAALLSGGTADQAAAHTRLVDQGLSTYAIVAVINLSGGSPTYRANVLEPDVDGHVDVLYTTHIDDDATRETWVVVCDLSNAANASRTYNSSCTFVSSDAIMRTMNYAFTFSFLTPPFFTLTAQTDSGFTTRDDQGVRAVWRNAGAYSATTVSRVSITAEAPQSTAALIIWTDDDSDASFSAADVSAQTYANVKLKAELTAGSFTAGSFLSVREHGTNSRSHVVNFSGGNVLSAVLFDTVSVSGTANCDTYPMYKSKTADGDYDGDRVAAVASSLLLSGGYGASIHSFVFYDHNSNNVLSALPTFAGDASVSVAGNMLEGASSNTRLVLRSGLTYGRLSNASYDDSTFKQVTRCLTDVVGDGEAETAGRTYATFTTKIWLLAVPTFATNSALSQYRVKDGASVAAGGPAIKFTAVNTTASDQSVVMRCTCANPIASIVAGDGADEAEFQRSGTLVQLGDDAGAATVSAAAVDVYFADTEANVSTSAGYDLTGVVTYEEIGQTWTVTDSDVTAVLFKVPTWYGLSNSVTSTTPIYRNSATDTTPNLLVNVRFADDTGFSGLTIVNGNSDADGNIVITQGTTASPGYITLSASYSPNRDSYADTLAAAATHITAQLHSDVIVRSGGGSELGVTYLQTGSDDLATKTALWYLQHPYTAFFGPTNLLLAGSGGETIEVINLIRHLNNLSDEADTGAESEQSEFSDDNILGFRISNTVLDTGSGAFSLGTGAPSDVEIFGTEQDLGGTDYHVLRLNSTAAGGERTLTSAAPSGNPAYETQAQIQAGFLLYTEFGRDFPLVSTVGGVNHTQAHATEVTQNEAGEEMRVQLTLSVRVTLAAAAFFYEPLTTGGSDYGEATDYMFTVTPYVDNFGVMLIQRWNGSAYVDVTSKFRLYDAGNSTTGNVVQDGTALQDVVGGTAHATNGYLPPSITYYAFLQGSHGLAVSRSADAVNYRVKSTLSSTSTGATAKTIYSNVAGQTIYDRPAFSVAAYDTAGEANVTAIDTFGASDFKAFRMADASTTPLGLLSLVLSNGVSNGDAVWSFDTASYGNDSYFAYSSGGHGSTTAPDNEATQYLQLADGVAAGTTAMVLPDLVLTENGRSFAASVVSAGISVPAAYDTVYKYRELVLSALAVTTGDNAFVENDFLVTDSTRFNATAFPVTLTTQYGLGTYTVTPAACNAAGTVLAAETDVIYTAATDSVDASAGVYTAADAVSGGSYQGDAFAVTEPAAATLAARALSFFHVTVASTSQLKASATTVSHTLHSGSTPGAGTTTRQLRVYYPLTAIAPASISLFVHNDVADGAMAVVAATMYRGGCGGTFTTSAADNTTDWSTSVVADSGSARVVAENTDAVINLKTTACSGEAAATSLMSFSITDQAARTVEVFADSQLVVYVVEPFALSSNGSNSFTHVFDGGSTTAVSVTDMDILYAGACTALPDGADNLGRRTALTFSLHNDAGTELPVYEGAGAAAPESADFTAAFAYQSGGDEVDMTQLDFETPNTQGTANTVYAGQTFQLRFSMAESALGANEYRVVGGETTPTTQGGGNRWDSANTTLFLLCSNFADHWDIDHPSGLILTNYLAGDTLEIDTADPTWGTSVALEGTSTYYVQTTLIGGALEDAGVVTFFSGDPDQLADGDTQVTLPNSFKVIAYTATSDLLSNAQAMTRTQAEANAVAGISFAQAGSGSATGNGSIAFSDGAFGASDTLTIANRSGNDGTADGTVFFLGLFLNLTSVSDISSNYQPLAVVVECLTRIPTGNFVGLDNVGSGAWSTTNTTGSAAQVASLTYVDSATYRWNFEDMNFSSNTSKTIAERGAMAWEVRLHMRESYDSSTYKNVSRWLADRSGDRVSATGALGYDSTGEFLTIAATSSDPAGGDKWLQLFSLPERYVDSDVSTYVTNTTWGNNVQQYRLAVRVVGDASSHWIYCDFWAANRELSGTALTVYQISRLPGPTSSLPAASDAGSDYRRDMCRAVLYTCGATADPDGTPDPDALTLGFVHEHYGRLKLSDLYARLKTMSAYTAPRVIDEVANIDTDGSFTLQNLVDALKARATAPMALAGLTVTHDLLNSSGETMGLADVFTGYSVAVAGGDYVIA